MRPPADRLDHSRGRRARQTTEETATQSVPREVVVTSVAFGVTWVALVVGILLAARRSSRARRWRSRLLAQWCPALLIALLFLLAGFARGQVNPLAVAVFCQALVGLALARDIPGFEPLPVARAVARRERALRSVGLMLALALLLYPVSQILGGIGMSIGGALGETNRTTEVAGSFPSNPIQSFFLLLGGAGIAEETIYRLVAVSLLWRLTRRAWVGVLGGALLFGLYHLSPLDGLYRTFWEFPISQLLATTLIGVLAGIVYVKRGFETAVLLHTLGDWLLLVLMGLGLIR